MQTINMLAYVVCCALFAGSHGEYLADADNLSGKFKDVGDEVLGKQKIQVWLFILMIIHWSNPLYPTV